MAWVMTQSKPKGLKFWCNKISHSALPVLASTIKTMKKIPRADSIPYSRLVRGVEVDPVLCWHLIRAANKRMKNATVDIESLQVSISMIGLDRFWKTVDSAPMLKPNPKSHFQLTYLRELTFSILAAQFAYNWATTFQLSNPKGVYWNTLLSRSPIWAMWFVAYPEMLKWQYQTRTHKRSKKAVELEIFGCRLEDICFGVAKLWKLPNTCYECWHPQSLPSPKDLVALSASKFSQALETKLSLRMAIQQPYFFSYLAHWAVLECRWSWYSPRLLRCLQVVSHIVRIPLNQVIDELRASALTTSRACYTPGLATPAVNLLWTDDRCWPTPAVYEPIYEFAPEESSEAVALSTMKAPTKEPQPQTTRVPEQPAIAIPPLDYARIDEVIDQLTLNADSLSDIHHVFKLCMSTMKAAMHFQRCFACLLNPQSQSLRVGYSEGFATTDPIRKLSMNLDQAPLFAHLLRHPSSMHVERASFDRVQKKLPNTLISKLNTQDFVLMSVFAGAKPIGIVYGDRVYQQQADIVRSEDYEAFKKLCHGVCVGLDHIAKVQKQKRRKRQI